MTETVTIVKQDIRYTVELVTDTCCVCQVPFALPADLVRRAREDTEVWYYCPNGHRQHYEEDEAARLRRKLAAEKSARERAEASRDAARADAVHQGDQRRAAERQVTAYKGTVTRMRKRAGAGLCQECQRSFENVARHMKAKHPEYTAES